MNGGTCAEDICLCQKGYNGAHCGQRKEKFIINTFQSYCTVNTTLPIVHFIIIINAIISTDALTHFLNNDLKISVTFKPCDKTVINS